MQTDIDHVVSEIITMAGTTSRDRMMGARGYAETDRISIYVRVQNRFLNEKMRFVVPLASFNVIADEDRGKGMFTAILVALAPQLRGKVDGIVVESIQAPRLAEHLRKRGFLDTNLDGFEREVSPTLFCPLD